MGRERERAHEIVADHLDRHRAQRLVRSEILLAVPAAALRVC
ncbi:hypothetical protein [Streptomyces luteolus]|uniref:Uncharacterized protein n=1 Tax=Streptomyces luteolus TaxID=3043615 RepID=A0ABT6SQV7_9ACTN|nr:hypothetical protein [Streptomyces sp. B-S-A12]MDI3417781.1 hypothetical protein [Streptomyces sp. B-S-A12]